MKNLTTKTKKVTTDGGTTFAVHYAQEGGRHSWFVENGTFAYLLANILNERHNAVARIERGRDMWRVLTNIKADASLPKTAPKAEVERGADVASPIYRQFQDLKRKHPDALLLFRVGEWYEAYCQDAVTAADTLGIGLTLKEGMRQGNGKGVSVAAFPFHALDTYLPRLVRAGHRVAICDQLENPKRKGRVTEEVIPAHAPFKDPRQRYREAKEAHPEEVPLILHFGKYYTYGEDAAKVAAALGREVERIEGLTEVVCFDAERINGLLPTFTGAGLRLALCNVPR